MRNAHHVRAHHQPRTHTGHCRYWKTLELKFSLRALSATAFRNFETTLLLGHGRGMLNNNTAAEARARLDELVGVTKTVEAIEVHRVQATSNSGVDDSDGAVHAASQTETECADKKLLPLDVQLAQGYGLSKQGHELFQLLALRMTARSSLFGTQMLEYADHQSTTVFTDLCSMCVPLFALWCCACASRVSTEIFHPLLK